MSRLLSVLAVAALLWSSNLGLADPLHHVSQHPEIQMWTYPNASGVGGSSVQSRGATFANLYAEDGQTLVQGTATGPSRLASVLVATDTTQNIPAGMAPSQYQVDSMRVTLTLVGSLIFEEFGFVLPYDNTVDSLEDLTSGSDDAGHPIEMYGVGLQGDYHSFSFDSVADPAALQLGDPRWRQYREGEDGYVPGEPEDSQPLAPYQYYSVDTLGRDSENAIVGGYSATEGTGETAPFASTPFAIGRVYDSQGAELSPGTLLNVGDQVVFEPDLSDSGVVSYLQQSLASGAVAFSFSSLHQPGGRDASAAYPDFYLDPLNEGHNTDGAAPVVELSVSIVEATPGDFDGDGMVDVADYAVWRQQYGGPGPDADGNADGVVDAADYTIWRDSLAPPAASSISVPEPSGVGLLGMFGGAMAFCGLAEWIARPKRDQEG